MSVSSTALTIDLTIFPAYTGTPHDFLRLYMQGYHGPGPADYYSANLPPIGGIGPDGARVVTVYDSLRAPVRGVTPQRNEVWVEFS